MDNVTRNLIRGASSSSLPFTTSETLSKVYVGYGLPGYDASTYGVAIQSSSAGTYLTRSLDTSGFNWLRTDESTQPYYSSYPGIQYSTGINVDQGAGNSYWMRVGGRVGEFSNPNTTVVTWNGNDWSIDARLSPNFTTPSGYWKTARSTVGSARLFTRAYNYLNIYTASGGRPNPHPTGVLVSINGADPGGLAASYVADYFGSGPIYQSINSIAVVDQSIYSTGIDHPVWATQFYYGYGRGDNIGAGLGFWMDMIQITSSNWPSSGAAQTYWSRSRTQQVGFYDKSVSNIKAFAIGPTTILYFCSSYVNGTTPYYLEAASSDIVFSTNNVYNPSDSPSSNTPWDFTVGAPASGINMVAVSGGGMIKSKSHTGGTWTTRTTNTTKDFNSVEWAGGAYNKYFACGNGGVLAFSSDGITWTVLNP